MPGSLKVILPFGCDEKEKGFKVQPDELVGVVAERIAKDQNLRDASMRTLYNPTTSKYCDPSLPLSNYKLTEKVVPNKFVELCVTKPYDLLGSC